MRDNPNLYEINAYVFVSRISEKYGRPLTLAAIPDDEFQTIFDLNFDLVWLMGVWQHSQASRQKALAEPALRRAYDSALPGWRDEDVVGSPYAVYSYKLDTFFGHPGELVELRHRLNRRGIRLLLDFVPNHLAADHPWISSHPGWFVRGTDTDIRQHPDWFFPNGAYNFAHGKDPYFPPWSDTVQVNFWSKELREALIGELLGIAEIADGVRCDMAMLALNRVFQQIWGNFVAGIEPPGTEFWPEAISRVKKRFPGFIFLAEVYWGLDQQLREMGFDYTYDKELYDLLLSSNAASIRGHLSAHELRQKRLAHFIENHDERRAITAFGFQRSLAAAAVCATIPGLHLFHDGQLEGSQVRLPVQLRREPQEHCNPEVRRFYGKLMDVCNSQVLHRGNWNMAEVAGTGDADNTSVNLLAWTWHYNSQCRLIIVNYAENPSRGLIRAKIPLSHRAGAAFSDMLSGERYEQDASAVAAQGLRVELKPWQVQILNIIPGT